MPILAEHSRDKPVTVTLKAETLLQFMLIAAKTPDISADEVAKIKDAITTTLNI